MRRIFLVPSGYNFRAVLAFCRALRLGGQEAAVMACTAEDPIFRTRFARNVVHIRTSRLLAVADFDAAVAAARARTGAARCVLAPTSEFLVRWAYQHRTDLDAMGCDLPLPDEAVYAQVTNKAAFTAFVRGKGLQVPAELGAESRSRYPVVAKPRWNVAADGRSLYPWLLRTAADRSRFEAQEREEDYFLQEWVSGESYYLLFYLPVAGAPTVFSQRNLAQQPGGKSIVLACAADLHETAEAERWAGVLRAAGFHGVAMVELRRRNEEYVLIEANPRLWGPLQLCVDGCPALLLRYIAENTGACPPPAAFRPARSRPYYLWYGGLTETAALDWHGETPDFPRLKLARRLAADVYLRPDAWRQFWHELRPRPNLEPARRVPVSAPLPTH